MMRGQSTKPWTPIRWLFPLLLLLSATAGACQGCGSNQTPPENADAAVGEPTLRLYLISTVAGALEPCGCSKDQLGGIDHLAAFIAKDKENAAAHLTLASGPLFFLDPHLDKKKKTQDSFKATAIADAVQALGLVAWTPGLNDWAAGGEQLTTLAKQSGAAMLTAGIDIEGGVSRKLVEAGGLKIGIVGVTDPKGRLGRYPQGVKAPDDLRAIMKSEIAALTKEGARLVVATMAMNRGEALRLADLEGLNLMLVGQPSSEGHANTLQAPPEIIGETLVVETANHGQTVAVVDIFVRDDKPQLQLADAGGVKKAEQVADVTRRINELQARLNSWEKGGNVDPKDIAARKADLEKLRAERTKLDEPTPAPKGSFFRYSVTEVREALGEDDAVAKRMLGFYKQVNEHNKEAFADLKPLPVSDGQAGYIGIEECTLCHAEATEVWEKTGHANAYETLTEGFKEYNLECVGCHVTGYGKPGGSTVTHNDKLRDVQCEDCHGPGSLHAKDPEAPNLITLKPDPDSCVSRCHHPPHVEGFDAVAKMDLVLGPGHGK